METIITLIAIIFLNIAVVFGVYAAFRYDYNLIDKRVENAQIFGYVAYWLDGFIYEFIRKPFYGCPLCMPTVWTPFVWFLCLQLPFDMTYFIVWIGSAGINKLIVENLEV